MVEFDLSQRQKLKDALDVRAMQAHPLLFVIMDPNNKTEQEVTYSIRQSVACKFLNLRLVAGKDHSPQGNIDLWNLQLKGVPLDFS